MVLCAALPTLRAPPSTVDVAWLSFGNCGRRQIVHNGTLVGSSGKTCALGELKVPWLPVNYLNDCEIQLATGAPSPCPR
jgi:hypothetical protein